jgi:hypothetical protein
MMRDPQDNQSSPLPESDTSQETPADQGSACPVNRPRFSIRGMIIVGAVGLFVGTELAKATGGTGLLIELGIPAVCALVGGWLGSKIPFG